MAAGAERLALLGGAAVLLLTSVHHVYGALRYDTPERYHAVVIAGVALALMLGLHTVSTRSGSNLVGPMAWWAGWSVNAIVAVLLFGLVEGFYNHMVKVVLYFGGLSEERLRWLYRDPLYELPNDLIFELTGVLQVVPAALAAYFLVQVVMERKRAQPSP
jgi:hypothetical protein